MTEALKDYLVVLAVNLALIAYVVLCVATGVGAAVGLWMTVADWLLSVDEG